MTFDSYGHHIFRGQLVDLKDNDVPIGICLQNREDYTFFFIYEGRKAIRFYLDADARAKLIAQLALPVSTVRPGDRVA